VRGRESRTFYFFPPTLYSFTYIKLLLNSAIVGLVGGLLGICLSTGISSLLPFLGMRLMGMGREGMTTVVTPTLLIYTLLISIGIGIVAGMIPAYRASKLKPVDALRYE